MIRLDGIEIDPTASNAQALVDRALKQRDDAREAEKQRADAAVKKAGIVKANALKLDARVKRIRAAFDAMKTIAKPCDECDGTGKVPDPAGGEKQVSCDFCDGKGSVTAHLLVKGLAAEKDGRIGEDPDGDDDDMDAADMEAELSPDEDMDADELEAEQATEEEAGAVKKDKARKDAAKRLREEARKFDAKQRASVQRRIDRAVRELAKLDATARRFGVSTEKLDADGIRKAVVAKLSPKAKLDGISPRELALKFETLTEAHADDAGSASDAARAGASPFAFVPRVDATEPKADGSHLDGRARMQWNLQHPPAPAK